MSIVFDFTPSKYIDAGTLKQAASAIPRPITSLVLAGRPIAFAEIVYSICPTNQSVSLLDQIDMAVVMPVLYTTQSMRQ